MPPKASDKNTRLAWMSGRLGAYVSNAKIISEACSLFGIAVSTARTELAEVYAHWATFSRENQEADRHKVLEALWVAVEEAQQGHNHHAVIAGLKEIAKIQGSYAPEKIKLEGGVTMSSGAPAPGTVRARMAALMADPKLREKALKLGLDLDAVDDTLPDSNGSS